MKIVTVVGARPQFIKAAAISRILREAHEEVIIHTGQHYDYNMSGVFFKELNIPEPDYNLGISGGSHGEMTGAMLPEIEKMLIVEKPDLVLVYGDTNSTLAAALAAVKLGLPICHVEAGNRLGTLTNPEEVNRICTDHVSSLLMCCTESAYDFLKAEGLSEKAYIIGDPMYDAYQYYAQQIESGKERFRTLVGLDGTPVAVPERYYYLTCHRPENVSSDDKLNGILECMNGLDYPTIYPVHPRNMKQVERLCSLNAYKNLILVEPVSYLTSISLIKGAEKIVTDSGGVQREAFFAGVQCVTVFDYIIWPETMAGNMNQMASADCRDISEKLMVTPVRNSRYQPFGNGEAGRKLLKILEQFEAKNGGHDQ